MGSQFTKKKKKIKEELMKNKGNMEESENNKKENNLERIEKTDSKINSHNPNEIVFLNDLLNDAYANYIKLNIFCTFKSIDDIFYLVYSTKNKSIVFYNLIDDKKVNEIKKAHDEFITNFRYYLDIINNRDLIISISLDDNNIKLWNIKNLECLLNIEHANEDGGLLSACFLNDNNNIYIVTSNQNSHDVGPVKIFDLNGKLIKKVNNSNYNTNFIDIYYSKSKIYILTCNDNFVKSFDYEQNTIFKTYKDSNIFNKNNPEYDYHNCVIIDDKRQMIESSEVGLIRIWDFYSAKLLKRITIIKDSSLNGFYLYNNEYLFAIFDDKIIRILELNNGKIIKELKGHNKEIAHIKAINHPIYGECIISQGYKDDGLKIWGYKNI